MASLTWSDARLNISNGAQKSVPSILNRKRKSELDLENQSLIADENIYVNIPTEPTMKPLQQSNRWPQQSSSSSRVPLGTITSASRNSSNISRSQSDSTLIQRSNRKQLQKSRTDKENVSMVISPERTGHSLAPPAKRFRMRESWAQFREFVSTPASTSSLLRGESPFPVLNWADREALWSQMCKKETGMYKRLNDLDYLRRHPHIQARMRAILLDWITEVCEVYRLNRETFYLAVDFIDRYLSTAKDIPKSRLQLIGVSCLFIASKIEEIYPPKLSEFAYVTDGACTEDEIIQMELVVLKGLNWGLTPVTPNAWMKLYMQFWHCNGKKNSGDQFVFPQYVGLDFAKIMQLVDLVTLDIGSLNFKYSVIAASALYHYHDETVALSCSGYEWHEIQDCVNWMSAYAFAIRESDPIEPRQFANVPNEDQHTIQAHSVDLSLLDRAHDRMAMIASTANRQSPDLQQQQAQYIVDMTPPEDGVMGYMPTSHHHPVIATSVFMSPTSPGDY